MALRPRIVDDDGSFLDAARVLLEREGPEIVGVASNAADAVDRAQTDVLISTHAGADIEDLLSASRVAGFVPKSQLAANAIHRIVGPPSPELQL